MSSGLNHIDELDEVQQLRAELASAQAEASLLREVDLGGANRLLDFYGIEDQEEGMPLSVSGRIEAMKLDWDVDRQKLRDADESNASLCAENEALARNAEALRAQHAQDAVELDSGNAARSSLERYRSKMSCGHEMRYVEITSVESGYCVICAYEAQIEITQQEQERAEAAEARVNEAAAWPNFIREYTDWSLATFPSGTALTASKHLTREAAELVESQEPEEVADCLMLLLFISKRLGIDILGEARKKFEINKTRQWNKPDADGIATHVRAPAPTAGTGNGD